MRSPVHHRNSALFFFDKKFSEMEKRKKKDEDISLGIMQKINKTKQNKKKKKHKTNQWSDEIK